MKSGPEGVKDELNPEEGGETMTALDRDLSSALRPVDPPDGFAERVLARAMAGDGNKATFARRSLGAKLLPWPVQSRWLGGAVAAALIAGLFAGGTTFAHRREQEHRAATATAQFDTAERVTDEALAHTRAQLERAGVFRDD